MLPYYPESHQNGYTYIVPLDPNRVRSREDKGRLIKNVRSITNKGLVAD
jgi:hypothetical protein